MGLQTIREKGIELGAEFVVSRAQIAPSYNSGVAREYLGVGLRN